MSLKVGLKGKIGRENTLWILVLMWLRISNGVLDVSRQHVLPLVSHALSIWV